MKKGFVFGFLAGAVLTTIAIRMAESVFKQSEESMGTRLPVPPGKIVFH